MNDMVLCCLMRHSLSVCLSSVKQKLLLIMDQTTAELLKKFNISKLYH